MTHIKVIQPDEAEGELKLIYNHLVETRGKLAEVHKIQSLNPKSIMNHMDLYMTIMFGQSPLKRYQREMIAVVVSSANNCDYCHTHHGAALNNFWKNADKVEKLRKDYTTVDISETDKLLCEYGYQLTKYPSKSTSILISQLKKLEVDDRTILDTSLVTSYFNFVNRMVMGLGVNLEDDKGEGYKYD